MKKLVLTKKLVLFLSVALLAASFAACATGSDRGTPSPAQHASGDAAFKTVHDNYTVEFLRRNPTVNTYLGGSGLNPSLREVDAGLRDHSAAALEAEDRWLAEMQSALERIDPNTLSPVRRIDRHVALAQIRFLLHQHQTRRYQERALDTYTDEPFRAIDWQLQGMTETGEKPGTPPPATTGSPTTGAQGQTETGAKPLGSPEAAKPVTARTYGTPEEWGLVIRRLQAIPRFLQVAQEQLAAGVKSGNTPDPRMIVRNGIETSEADARYFEETLPKLAEERIAAGEQREHLLAQVRTAAKSAADSYRGLREFVRQTFFENPAATDTSGLKAQFRADRFVMGEEEYNWALRNNLRIEKPAAQLYEEAWPVVEATRREMMDLSRKIGEKRNLKLPADGALAVRAVFDDLSKDYPKSDAEMVNWYAEAAFRLVDYARRTGIFDVPADYRLDVVETPPPLRASIDGAAYYPAPPFKNSGVGRFYVTPTDNDPAALKTNNRAALADLSAHEGFPGHDWHYKMMTQFRSDISSVRWLTPGAVEDSSSMWEDSMASEGWALYSEALMAEPQPGAPEGFYTPEERLYQLQGKLYRDLRVRIDTGIHTGRMSYNDAVDLFSEIVDFLPGKCSDATVTPTEDKRASCKGAANAIFRYSKWPTQAITYRLGKDQIYALREEAARIAGASFSPKEFHLLFMKQGTIPSGYFREELLRTIREKSNAPGGAAATSTPRA